MSPEEHLSDDYIASVWFARAIAKEVEMPNLPPVLALG